MVLEFYLFLRWTCWFAWRDSWKVAAKNANQVMVTHGLKRWQLLCKLLKLSLLHGMNPVQIFYYNLFLSGANYWEFVFENEVGAFHRWRDGEKSPAGIEILTDKKKTLDILNEKGLCHTQTYFVLNKKNAEPDWNQFSYPLFLKPRFGSGGKNCFYVRLEHGVLFWQKYESKPHSSESAYLAWRKASAEMDYLIQPCYENALSIREIHADLITLRVLTKKNRKSWDVDLAYLEIPKEISGYYIQAVDLVSGLLLPSTTEMKHIRDIWLNQKLASLPHWQQAAASAIVAHEAVAPEIFSVAWDFILVEHGAMLLEGNSSWGVCSLQKLRGPLLSRRR